MRLFSLLLYLVSASPVATADEQYWLYTVRPGDTIWELTRKHCTSVRYWQRIQKLNGIDLDREIPPGTRLRFPLSILKHQPAAATVAKLHGDARLVRAGSQTPESLAVDTRLRSGDRVMTGRSSNLTLRFADGSLLLILEDSEVVMDALGAWGSTGMVDTQIRLKAGRVDTHAQPSRGPGSRYRIITPAAVAAVRGTAFRVAADGDRAVMRSEVTGGRVAVGNDAGGGTVDVPAGFGLVAQAGEPPPPPRKLLAPPNLEATARVQRGMPLGFAWQALDGAQGYRVQIAPSSAFDTLLADLTVTAPAAQWPDLADGRYALRVRGIDTTGLEGIDAVMDFEVDARPFAPVPDTPADDGVVDDDRPRFAWTADDHRGRYRVQLARDPAFRDLVADHTLAGNTWVPDRALSSGDYYWRAAAIDAHGKQGPFSQSRHFTRRQPLVAPETAPVLVEPAHLVFRWRGVIGAGNYQVQVAGDPGFNDLLADYRVPGTQLVLPRPPSQLYYFRVRALTPADEPGPFSAPQKFYVPTLYRWWPMVFAIPVLLAL